jgi:hypothetical protein
MAQLVGGGMAVPLLTLGRDAFAQAPPAAPTNVRLVTGSPAAGGAKPALTRSDIVHQGYFDVSTNGQDTPFSQGLTHRYVNGELRFLLLDYMGSNPAMLTELALRGAKFGDTVSTVTNRWASPWENGTSLTGIFAGLWWDSAASRLWTVDAIDYNATFRQVQIRTRTLNADGTVSDVRGPIGLNGIPDKRVYGGVQPVPTWFQSQYGVGPYAVGFGGYTSLMAQAGAASVGPTLYAIPELTGFANNTEIPQNSFKTLMDCASGTVGTDWYLNSKATAPSSFDRGIRVTPVTNYFDGNDPRMNPSTPPTVPPTPGNWLSPAPDGYGRWTWGDSYYGAGCWIDGPNKQGFLAIASLAGGKAWYATSTLNFDSRKYEFHIYDSAHLGEAATNKRQPWNVKPVSAWEETAFTGLGHTFLQGNTPVDNVSAVTYDATTQTLYVMTQAGGNTVYQNRLHVYQVAA